MRIWTCVLLTCLALPGLAGCKSKAIRMSEYPYFVELLDQRWEISRKSLASDKPNVSYVAVLLKDLTEVVKSMQRTYTSPNRDQALAKAQQITQTFETDLSKQVDMTGAVVVLLPNVTAKDVSATVEKAYQEYRKFREMVKI